MYEPFFLPEIKNDIHRKQEDTSQYRRYVLSKQASIWYIPKDALMVECAHPSFGQIHRVLTPPSIFFLKLLSGCYNKN